MQPVRKHVGETDRRINKRKTYYNKRDKDSHLPNHSRESHYTHVWKDDFKILNGNYKSGIQGKISETLYIRSLKPTLDVKEKSFRLKLYNYTVL